MSYATRADHRDDCVEGELRQEIERLLTRRHDRRRRIESLSRQASEFASSHRMDELDVILDDGTELQLVSKHVGLDGLLAGARHTRPGFLQHSMREVELYRSVLGVVGASVPTYYGTLCAPSQRGILLVLERISGLELRRIGDLSVWKQAALVLGMLHVRMKSGLGKDASQRAPLLIRYDSAFYWRWLARAVKYVSQESSRWSLADRRSFSRMARRYGRVVDHLTSLPRLAIHGDCFPSNVLVAVETGQERICFVDWEMAGAGPGLVDVAALVSGSWTDREREELLAAYRDGLLAFGGEAAPLDEMQQSLEFCRLHLAVQLLGWSPHWEPPFEQRQDWLSEALQRSNQLNL